MNWSTRTLSALALVALVTLAGCSAALTSADNADEIAQQVQDRHDRIDDVHGVQSTTIDGPGQTASTTVEYWQRPPDQTRQEVIASSGANSTGDVVVNDGNTSWYYDSDANEVTRMTVEVNVTASSLDASVVERMLDEYDVELAGTETVAGRETQILELTPANDTAGMAYEEATVWVDTEYWYPIKYEADLTVGGNTTTITTTHEEIAFNEGVADDRFTFEPPEGAEVTTTRSQVTEVEDLAAADERTDFAVGDPSVPDAYALSGVQVAQYDDRTSVMATYESDGESLSYVARQGGDLPDGESIAVGDGQGVLTETGEYTSVYVECDGVVHYVASSDADRDELADALASLECT